MQYGALPPPSRANAQELPRQMQQGHVLHLPARADQARRLHLVPGSGMGRPLPDSFARLRGQAPRQIDEATRIQQQQASSSEDF